MLWDTNTATLTKNTDEDTKSAGRAFGMGQRARCCRRTNRKSGLINRLAGGASEFRPGEKAAGTFAAGMAGGAVLGSFVFAPDDRECRTLLRGHATSMGSHPWWLGVGLGSATQANRLDPRPRRARDGSLSLEHFVALELVREIEARRGGCIDDSGLRSYRVRPTKRDRTHGWTVRVRLPSPARKVPSLGRRWVHAEPGLTWGRTLVSARPLQDERFSLDFSGYPDSGTFCPRRIGVRPAEGRDPLRARGW